MAAIPQPFGTIPTQAIASYDFIEFASGEGLVAFYGYMSNENGTNKYNLTSNSSIDSLAAETNCYAGLDLDFDTAVFNRPVELSGTVILSTPRAWNRSGEATTVWTYAELIKVNSAETETLLQTASGAQVSNNTAGVQSHYALLKMPLTTNYKISPGEKIRVNIQFWSSGGACANHAMGHSPKGTYAALFNSTDTPNVNTQNIVLIPFKVDL